MFTREAHRVGAAGGGEHRVSAPQEHARRQGAHRFLVFHEQNRFISGRRDRCMSRLALDNARRVRHGQRDSEGGSSSRFAVHANAPVALRHETVHRGESEPRALAHGLRRKERL